MTDRVRHLTIILEADLRVDDLDAVTHAIEQIRGVASVERHVVGANDVVARIVARNELRREIYDFLETLFRRD